MDPNTDNLLEGIGVEAVHQVVVLLVRDEPPVLLERPGARILVANVLEDV